MKIAIMSPSARSNDAVGYDALSMYRTLKRAGADVELLTRDGRDELAIGRTYADALWLLGGGDLLIYHACTDDPDALNILRACEARMVVKYHNITPPEFFLPYSAAFADACRLGRQGLRMLVDAPVEMFLCDSEFNALDLKSHGASEERLRVFPPFHPTETLLSLEKEPATLAYLDRSAPNLLMVGRIVPNKRHDLALSLVELLKVRFPKIHLQVIGQFDARLQGYTSELKSRIARSGLDDFVSFHPIVNAQGLASYYRRSEALLMMSAHEGFGVPLVEALGFGLPVAALSEAAIPETLGSAGLIAATVEELSARLTDVLQNDGVREKVVSAGRLRYTSAFNPPYLERGFLDLVASLQSNEKSVGSLKLSDPSWFGFPAWNEVVKPPTTSVGFTLDGQRRAIQQVMQSSEASTRKFFSEAEVRVYASRLLMPFSAYVTPIAARLAYVFSPDLQALFPLRTIDDAQDFAEWFRRIGFIRYPALEPLLGSNKRSGDG